MSNYLKQKELHIHVQYRLQSNAMKCPEKMSTDAMAMESVVKEFRFVFIQAHLEVGSIIY